MKKKLFMKTLLAIAALVLITNSCKKNFYDDDYGVFTKTTSVNINYKSVLDFEIGRYFIYDNGTIENVLDSIFVTNISGDELEALDFSIDFYSGFDNGNRKRVLSFMTKTGDIVHLDAYEKSSFFLSDEPLAFLDVDKIDINVLKTGKFSDFESSGIFDIRYVYSKVDTAGVLVDNYDTTLIEAGRARAIVDFEGNLKLVNNEIGLIRNLNGFVDRSLFVGQLVLDYADTINVEVANFNLPQQLDVSSLNSILFSRNEENEFVFLFELNIIKTK